MKTIAVHTLGCKVNQYDTQAMLELFKEAGYGVVPFSETADVYLINTCTVTGTGDKKSLQLTRRIRRAHPGSEIILCGCLAQRQGEALLETGARLIIGTQRRHDVVKLFEQALAEGRSLCAVESLHGAVPFELLTVHEQEEHTRATLKIQEGCCNRCTYCIIPEVRGPIRSRPLAEIRAETERLAAAGYTEMVLTGIHLSSYGLDLKDGSSLIDAIRCVAEVPGVLRVRLGSLEPGIATEAFAAALRELGKVCPQFHLALQSGSDSVLQRMHRRYTADGYRQAAAHLRACFPDCAITTDVLTGFPGETEAEFAETAAFIREIGFARIHVFPYSQRDGTPAATLPGQLSTGEKECRARRLIAIGRETAASWLQTWLGREAEVLAEEAADGFLRGYTPEYIPVRWPDDGQTPRGSLVRVRLLAADSPDLVTAEALSCGG